MKNHSRNLHVPLCGIFCPNSVAVARYGALIRTKSPTNCDAHLAESLFQTRSRAFFKHALSNAIAEFILRGIPMLYLRKIKYHVFVAILSASLIFPVIGNEKQSPELLAWWGTIYPQFCFMENPDENEKEAAKPRIHFWIMETFQNLVK